MATIEYNYPARSTQPFDKATAYFMESWGKLSLHVGSFNEPTARVNMTVDETVHLLKSGIMNLSAAGAYPELSPERRDAVVRALETLEAFIKERRELLVRVTTPPDA